MFPEYCACEFNSLIWFKETIEEVQWTVGENEIA